MHTEDLRAFFTIVESGSLTAAARRLRVPKSTLGRRLTRLEEELDAPLVIRTPRQTQITELGRRLYERGEPLVSALDELESNLLDFDSTPTGPIRVAAPKDLATSTLGELCASYLDQYPEVRVELVASNAGVDLLADSFDLAFRIHFGRLPDTQSLQARRLIEVEVGLFAAPSYLASNRQPAAPKSLGSHRLLSMQTLLPRWALERTRDGASAQIGVRPVMSSNDHHALLAAARAGAGVASLPTFLARPALEGGELRRVLPTWRLSSATLSLLWPRGRHLSPRVRAFIDVATAHFAGQS